MKAIIITAFVIVLHSIVIYGYDPSQGSKSYRMMEDEMVDPFYMNNNVANLHEEQQLISDNSEIEEDSTQKNEGDDNVIPSDDELAKQLNEEDFSNIEENNEVTSQDVLTCQKQHINSVDTGYYTSNVAVGGNGGSIININEKGERSGVIVRGIKFWKRNTKPFPLLRGIEVELSNGHRMKCGFQHGEESDMFYFAPEERMTEMKIYGNGKCNGGGRTTGISFKTNKQRSFSFIASQSSRSHVYNYDIGSGILVGFILRCGHDIDAMGPVMLRQIKSSKLSRVSYPGLNGLAIASKPIRVDTVSFDNTKGTSPQTYKLTGTKAITETASWSRTTSLDVEIGAELTVEASALFFTASATFKFAVKKGVSYTHSYELSTTTTRSYEFPITVSAGKKVSASAVIYEGAINTPYTGLVTHTLNSGRVFKYRVRGMYTGVTASQIIVSTKEI